MEVADSVFDKLLNLYFLPDEKYQRHPVGPAWRTHWIAKIATDNNHLERSNSFKKTLNECVLLAKPSFSVVVIVVEAAVEVGQVLEVVFFTDVEAPS